MKKNCVITIGREFGSGGRIIGKKLAEELNIPYYDKELLAKSAQENGISEEIFKNLDESVDFSYYYYSVGLMINPMVGVTDLSIHDKVQMMQADMIRKLAEEGPCVIVGRCSDYILQDSVPTLNVFILADKEDKEKRAVEDYGLKAEGISETLVKMDKQRAQYYNFYTTKRWGKANNYDVCLNSSQFGIDGCVQILKEIVENMK